MALGKGLGQILEEVGMAYESEMQGGDNFAKGDAQERIQELDVLSIDPNPYQPRKHFDETRLKELSDSIREHGLLQPVVVVSRDDRYILVAGERRLRAHKLAELPTIRAIVAEVDFDDLRMRELALVENIQRENLNAIELANSYQELLDVHEITHEGLAQIVHKSRSQITNTLRLLSLPSYAQQMITEEKITQGHAKILVGLDPQKVQVLVDTIIGQKLSVRETENLLKQKKAPRGNPRSTPSTVFDPALVEKLKQFLPFSYTLKGKKLEIVLPNEDTLIKFITLLEKK
jgi:ParB family chromosome partitioning protein